MLLEIVPDPPTAGQSGVPPPIRVELAIRVTPQDAATRNQSLVRIRQLEMSVVGHSTVLTAENQNEGTAGWFSSMMHCSSTHGPERTITNSWARRLTFPLIRHRLSVAPTA